MKQERRDLVSHSSGSLGPITSLSGSSAFASGPRLSHAPSSADFQPPYFPPPYNHQPDFHSHAAHVNAVVAAASDPYSLHNSLANTQQYHQLHPAAQAARGHNVLSRRDEENLHLQQHMHSSGLSASVYGDGVNSVSVSNSSVSRRGSDMVYASVRRPDVLMHGGHHTLSEQDLLNLHNAQALSALEDGQVSTYLDYRIWTDSLIPFIMIMCLLLSRLLTYSFLLYLLFPTLPSLGNSCLHSALFLE